MLLDKAVVVGDGVYRYEQDGLSVEVREPTGFFMDKRERVIVREYRKFLEELGKSLEEMLKEVQGVRGGSDEGPRQDDRLDTIKVFDFLHLCVRLNGKVNNGASEGNPALDEFKRLSASDYKAVNQLIFEVIEKQRLSDAEKKE